MNARRRRNIEDESGDEDGSVDSHGDSETEYSSTDEGDSINPEINERDKLQIEEQNHSKLDLDKKVSNSGTGNNSVALIDNSYHDKEKNGEEIQNQSLVKKSKMNSRKETRKIKKKDPAFVPRGMFFLHDNREDEMNNLESKQRTIINNQQEKVEEPLVNQGDPSPQLEKESNINQPPKQINPRRKQVELDDVWKHDKFDENEKQTKNETISKHNNQRNRYESNRKMNHTEGPSPQEKRINQVDHRATHLNDCKEDHKMNSNQQKNNNYERKESNYSNATPEANTVGALKKNDHPHNGKVAVDGANKSYASTMPMTRQDVHSVEPNHHHHRNQESVKNASVHKDDYKRGDNNNNSRSVRRSNATTSNKNNQSSVSTPSKPFYNTLQPIQPPPGLENVMLNPSAREFKPLPSVSPNEKSSNPIATMPNTTGPPTASPTAPAESSIKDHTRPMSQGQGGQPRAAKPNSKPFPKKSYNQPIPSETLHPYFMTDVHHEAKISSVDGNSNAGSMDYTLHSMNANATMRNMMPMQIYPMGSSDSNMTAGYGIPVYDQPMMYIGDPNTTYLNPSNPNALGMEMVDGSVWYTTTPNPVALSVGGIPMTPSVANGLRDLSNGTVYYNTGPPLPPNHHSYGPTPLPVNLYPTDPTVPSIAGVMNTSTSRPYKKGTYGKNPSSHHQHQNQNGVNLDFHAKAFDPKVNHIN